FENMAGTEHQHAARRDRHLVAGLGVTTHALALLPYRERAKGRQLHGLALGQGAANLFQHILDHLGRVGAGQAHGLENRFREVGARQGSGHGPTTPIYPQKPRTVRKGRQYQLDRRRTSTVSAEDCPERGISGRKRRAGYQRRRQAPQVNPAPMASSKTRSPCLIRPSFTAVANASGTEAAEVLPWLATVEITLAGSMPSFLAVPSRIRWLAWC